MHALWCAQGQTPWHPPVMRRRFQEWPPGPWSECAASSTGQQLCGRDGTVLALASQLPPYHNLHWPVAPCHQPPVQLQWVLQPVPACQPPMGLPVQHGPEVRQRQGVSKGRPPSSLSVQPTPVPQLRQPPGCGRTQPTQFPSWTLLPGPPLMCKVGAPRGECLPSAWVERHGATPLDPTAVATLTPGIANAPPLPLLELATRLQFWAATFMMLLNAKDMADLLRERPPGLVGPIPPSRESNLFSRDLRRVAQEQRRLAALWPAHVRRPLGMSPPPCRTEWPSPVRLTRPASALPVLPTGPSLPHTLAMDVGHRGKPARQRRTLDRALSPQPPVMRDPLPVPGPALQPPLLDQSPARKPRNRGLKRLPRAQRLAKLARAAAMRVAELEEPAGPPCSPASTS